MTTSKLPPSLYVIMHNVDDPAHQGYGANLGVQPHDYSESIKPDAVQCNLVFHSEQDAWRWLGVTTRTDPDHARAMRTAWCVRELHPQPQQRSSTGGDMARAVMDFETICTQRDALLKALEAAAGVAIIVRKSITG